MPVRPAPLSSTWQCYPLANLQNAGTCTATDGQHGRPRDGPQCILCSTSRHATVRAVPRPLSRFTKYFARSTVDHVKRELGGPLSWNLTLLASIFGTDKAINHYTTLYAHHLRARRRSVKSVLETGIGGYDDPQRGGESLRMWRSYFPHAVICGIDIIEKRLLPDSRIVVLQGDQSDHTFLAGVV